MNWVDIVVLILIGCAAATEAKRGFGLALFTLVGAFISLELSLIWSGPFSKSLRLLAQPGPNKALALGIIFLGLMLVFTLLIYLLHPDTFLSLDPFDNLLGAVCGIASGWILAYVFLMGVGFWGAKDLVQSSMFAPEILHFETYHRILSSLRGLGETQKGKYNY